MTTSPRSSSGMASFPQLLTDSQQRLCLLMAAIPDAAGVSEKSALRPMMRPQRGGRTEAVSGTPVGGVVSAVDYRQP